MATRNHKLTDEQKRFIITSLAVYKPVRDIQAGLKDNFGLDLEWKKIDRYNPGSSEYRGGKELTDLFNATRQKFIDEVASHPAAHQAYRVLRLGQMAEKAFERNNFPLAAKLFEQVAREVGGAFTNEVKVKGSVRHAVKHTIEDMTIDEKRNMLASAIAGAVEKLGDNRKVH